MHWRSDRRTTDDEDAHDDGQADDRCHNYNCRSHDAQDEDDGMEIHTTTNDGGIRTEHRRPEDSVTTVGEIGLVTRTYDPKAAPQSGRTVDDDCDGQHGHTRREAMHDPTTNDTDSTPTKTCDNKRRRRTNDNSSHLAALNRRGPRGS